LDPLSHSYALPFINVLHLEVKNEEMLVIACHPQPRDKLAKLTPKPLTLFTI
jgi:hypothetical protein